MPLPCCPNEDTTQHYLGSPPGHGPVGDEERVAYAVFEKSKQNGTNLVDGEFRSKDLKRGCVSLARSAHTTLADFMTNVAAPAAAEMGALIGVVFADVANIRSITYPLLNSKSDATARGLCVLDKVEPKDHDGHAALKFGETIEGLPEGQKTTARAFVIAELMHRLSEIIPAEDVFM